MTFASTATNFDEAIERTKTEIDKTIYGAKVNDVPSFNLRSAYASRTIWRFIFGHLRGQIPFPVPEDIAGVAYAAATRYLALLEEMNTDRITREGSVTPGTFRAFSGFQLHEVLILNRYRRTTA